MSIKTQQDDLNLLKTLKLTQALKHQRKILKLNYLLIIAIGIINYGLCGLCFVGQLAIVVVFNWLLSKI
jgi:hypothetical protein